MNNFAIQKLNNFTMITSFKTMIKLSDSHKYLFKDKKYEDNPVINKYINNILDKT